MEEILQSFSIQPSSSIPIIISQVIYQFLGSGFEFRGWIYTTAFIILIPKRLSPKINTMSTFLKVRGIGAFKHKSAEFIVLSLYFPSTNNTKQLVYTSLKYGIHFIKEL